MNDFQPTSLSDFYLSPIYFKNIELWEKHHNKPLFIYGDSGCGKTSISNIIHENKSVIHINSHNIKMYHNITTYITDSMKEKSVYMMIDKKYEYKTIIIDDLSAFLKGDYSNFLNIYKWIIHNLHYKIIIISDNKYNKHIQTLINKSHYIHISYTEQNINEIIHKYTSKPQLIANQLNTNNINIIKHHITSIINYTELYDYKYDYSNDLITILSEPYISFEYISRTLRTDIYYISHNLVENAFQNIKHNEYTISIIKYIYDTFIYSNSIYPFYLKTHNTELMDNIMYHSIYIPYRLIRIHKKNALNIINHKYNSKSLIYIHQKKIAEKYKTYNMLYNIYILNLIHNNRLSEVKGEQYIYKGKEIIKFLKVFQWIFNEKFLLKDLKKLM